MNKVLFIDAGVIITDDSENEQTDTLEKLNLIPGAISSLSKISRELDYELVLLTTHNSVSSGSFAKDRSDPVRNKVLQILKGEGIIFSEIISGKTEQSGNARTINPDIASLSKYLARGTDLNSSYLIGDSKTDKEFAESLGCGSIFLGNEMPTKADYPASCWDDIFQFLKKKPRMVSVERKTLETKIFVKLNLDGSGRCAISTNIRFFDHMLEQIARHGNFDLTINAIGDLHVDEHHTIEDVAIALGKSFSDALGSRKGIERYGFVLPMDDCLVQAAIDFGGRAWLVWDADFKREKIGEMPVESFYHFFKSFSDNAKCNLNIKAEGINEHHKIEAIFKAFAKVMEAAVKKTDKFEIPSSKGSL
jgi:imidazoleglycerol-phosphate dehydratase/histidinol-phosphatase